LDTNPFDEQHDRPLPQSIEAEEAVLGAILLEPQMIDQAVLNIQSSACFSPANRKIYAAMLEIVGEEKPIDLMILVDRLETKGWLDQVGGVSYLTNLAQFVPTAANIGHYIEIINEKNTQRQLIEAAKDISQSAFDTEDATQTLLAAQSKLETLAGGVSSQKLPRKIGEILRECYEDIEHNYVNRDGTGITGIPSGYDDLDQITGGFQRSDSIIVAARPSVGKTAFALNISRNAAKETGRTVAIFSLEMSEKQLGNRMISAESCINASRIRSGHLAGDDWEQLTVAIGLLDGYPIVIDDTPGITVLEIRAKCRKLAKECDLGMVVIDYLQLIETLHRNGINRQQEITEISRALKKLAKELDIPVIALSQLSRAVEQRQDKRPMLSDLRESGSIEQDADIVAFLYRDDYYDKESEKKNIIEIIIAKQRNGPVGTVDLGFMKNYNKFVNLDRSHQEIEKTDQQRDGKAIPDMYRQGR
jgi:replicative DNA helicase